MGRKQQGREDPILISCPYAILGHIHNHITLVGLSVLGLLAKCKLGTSSYLARRRVKEVRESLFWSSKSVIEGIVGERGDRGLGEEVAGVGCVD